MSDVEKRCVFCGRSSEHHSDLHRPLYIVEREDQETTRDRRQTGTIKMRLTPVRPTGTVR